MAFDINQFIGELNGGGVVKTNLYEVVLTRNGNPDTQVERQISMRADTFNIPGRSVNTVDVSYSGPVMKIATDGHYEQTTMSIILSEDQSEREYFEEWFDLISGKLRTEGANTQTAYAVGYYDEYVGSIRVTMYNETEKQTYAYEFVNAYPISIGEMELNYDGVQIGKLSVTFAFHYYKTEKL